MIMINSLQALKISYATDCRNAQEEMTNMVANLAMQVETALYSQRDSAKLDVCFYSPFKYLCLVKQLSVFEAIICHWLHISSWDVNIKRRSKTSSAI